MSSISARNGRWHVRIRKNGHPTLCKAFTKKAHAIAWGKRTESDIESGRLSPVARTASSVITLGDALRLYRTTITPTKRGHVQESSLINVLLTAPESKVICALPIGRVGQADIAQLRDRWLTAGLAPATARNRLLQLSHTYSISAKEWGLQVGNPVAMVRMPKVQNERSRRLLDGEFERVVAATKSEELPAIATLAVETAMRLGEIVSLEWQRVDLDQRCITLRQSKNGHGRFIPLSPLALATLRSVPRRVDGRVFVMLADGASKAWASAVRRSRQEYIDESSMLGRELDDKFLVDLHFHDLRHEACSRLATMGFDVLELASISGHRTLSMLRRYTHLKTSRLAEKLAAASQPLPTTYVRLQ